MTDTNGELLRFRGIFCLICDKLLQNLAFFTFIAIFFVTMVAMQCNSAFCDSGLR